MTNSIETPVEKKRYEWIDNARIIAAWLIVCVHMPIAFSSNPFINCAIARELVTESTYCGRVPFFLILAGYFLGRKITWSKALDRALWLLIPFVIWNFLYYAWTHHALNLDILQTIRDIPKIIGFGAIFSVDTTMFGLMPSGPSIAATWFLRDIIILSLITPILAKHKKLLLIIVLLASIFYQDYNLSHACTTLLLPWTCIYYILGVALADFRISDAYMILNKKFTPFVILGFLTAICFILLKGPLFFSSFQDTILSGIFGALMIAHCGVLIENHLPKLSKKLAPCGPACFLVFVLHYPFLTIIHAFILPPAFNDSVWAWSVSVFTCIIIMAFFLLMKRYTPWLMPYLGHMKVPK